MVGAHKESLRAVSLQTGLAIIDHLTNKQNPPPIGRKGGVEFIRALLALSGQTPSMQLFHASPAKTKSLSKIRLYE